MASKKEFKRRQKRKEREAKKEKARQAYRPEPVINDRELLRLAGEQTGGAPECAAPEATEKEREQKTAESVRRIREAEEARMAREREGSAQMLEEKTVQSEETQARQDAAQVRRATEVREREAREAEKARLEAEEMERQRREARDRAAAEAVMERAKAEREARDAEEARFQAEKEEQARRADELAQREQEEEERRRQEAAAAERARKMAEEAERMRRAAEMEKARREAEEAERLRAAEETVEIRRREAEVAAERAKQMAVAAERARSMAEQVERARREAEVRDRAAFAEDGMQAPERPVAEPVAVALSGQGSPRLEVENPYWEKQPEIFEMLSGAPQGAPADEGEYGTDGNRSQAMPVSVEGERVELPRPEFVVEGVDADQDRMPDAETTTPVPLEDRMYIVMVTPEVAPCAKVGGLGDVILGLGRELMKRGHGVEVICPMYSSMRYDQIQDLHEEYGELWCPHYGEWRAEKVFQGKVEGGLQVNFITGGNYTERDSIYGYDDDLQRFTYFSRQALEFMFKTNRRPDIIHCHDWATGLVPAILWDIYQKLGWDNSRVAYTIHNNECQGLCGFSDKLLGLVGLDARKYHVPDKMQDDSHKNCINMMKAGIVFSNFVTTVSPTYAGELKTVAGGRGLQTTIAKNSAKVGGVLNGIDYDSWNPKTDPKLAARYSVGEDFFEKYKNKAALREWLGLNDAWRPIVSVVTRLTQQKGLDLIKQAIYATLEMEGQFVLLGSAPDPRINADFLRMQNELKDNHDVNLYIGYHEDLSRMIYAGSDMFLIPSLYEPCGLTQMISLRYGTVPIVRETGGLVDTVFDLDNSGRGLNDANGFTFRDPNYASLRYGLDRAIRLWYDNPEAFNRLARNGMRYDYSWKGPAGHYENIYNYIKA